MFLSSDQKRKKAGPLLAEPVGGGQALASHTGRELPFHMGQVLTPPYSPQLGLKWTLSFMHMNAQNLFRIIHSLKLSLWGLARIAWFNF